MVEIDTHKLAVAVAAALPHKADLRRALQGIGSAARHEWIKVAKRELNTTAQDYIRGIQDIETDGMRVTISLVGVLPNMVEQGMSAFDMRQTLLGPGSNAKTAKDGSRYNTVPFRHGTPGTGGRNVGRPMPRAIHNVAKALEPTMSRPGGLKAGPGGHTVAYGERIHPGMPMGRAAKKIMERREQPHHTASIYAGMIKQLKVYGPVKKGEGQHSYHTFRRISSRVTSGWQHPGISARLIHRKVQKYIARVQGQMIKAATRP